MHLSKFSLKPMTDILESDWKIFKKIKQKAIETFSNLCLKEFSEIIGNESKSSHDRYLLNYRIVINRDKQMALIFGDNTSRSKAFLQLLAIRGENLADEALVSQQSPEFREKTNPERVNW